MSNQYNLYNFEASFKNYLLAGNILPITLKNYLSDFRHFIGWLTLYLKTHLELTKTDLTDFNQFQLILTEEIINEYKLYLRENNIPIKTINRRLSTLRKFCSFCIVQGWIKENPAKKISNFNNQKPKPIVLKELLENFRISLQKEGYDQPTIKSYLDNVREFLSI